MENGKEEELQRSARTGLANAGRKNVSRQLSELQEHTSREEIRNQGKQNLHIFRQSKTLAISFYDHWVKTEQAIDKLMHQ